MLRWPVLHSTANKGFPSSSITKSTSRLSVSRKKRSSILRPWASSRKWQNFSGWHPMKFSNRGPGSGTTYFQRPWQRRERRQFFLPHGRTKASGVTLSACKYSSWTGFNGRAGKLPSFPLFDHYDCVKLSRHHKWRGTFCSSFDPTCDGRLFLLNIELHWSFNQPPDQKWYQQDHPKDFDSWILL